MADDQDDLYDAVSAMADRLGLEGKERSSYIHESMTRGGYRAVPQYVREDNEDGEDSGGGFFGRGRSKQQPRDRRGSRPTRDQRDDDDWR